MLKQIKSNNYDLFMSVSCNERQIYKNTIETIKQIGIPTLCFRPDNLSVPMFDKEVAPLYDLVWLTADDTRYLYDKWGVTSFFAPYAANPYVYVYREFPLIRKICFIGTPHGSRTGVINRIANSGTGIDLFYGKNESVKNEEKSTIKHKYEWQTYNRWERYYNDIRFKEGRRILKASVYDVFNRANGKLVECGITKKPSLSFEDMINSYSQYVLSLSFTSYSKTDILSNNLPVVNLRNFEIPMCGGIQFCRYSKEMADYFEEGKEIVMYNDDKNFSDKLNYYLKKATDKEIYAIKTAARRRSEAEHTWWNRFTKAFDLLGLKY